MQLGDEALVDISVKVEPPVTVTVNVFPETGTSDIFWALNEASVR
jgi:hypothetical protein